MKKFVIGTLASIFLCSAASAATVKESFTEDETMNILTYIYVGKDMCQLNVKEEDFDAWLYQGLQYGYSLEELTNIMTKKAVDMVFVHNNAKSMEEFCSNLLLNLNKELYVQ